MRNVKSACQKDHVRARLQIRGRLRLARIVAEDRELQRVDAHRRIEAVGLLLSRSEHLVNGETDVLCDPS